jgi:hypothetical protein
MILKRAGQFSSAPIGGVGIGSYNVEIDKLVSQQVGIYYAPHASHILYLGIMAQLGLLGFGALLWVIGAAIRMAKKNSNGITSHMMWIDIQGLSAALFGTLFYAVFHYGIYFNLLWVSLGLFTTVYTIRKQPET